MEDLIKQLKKYKDLDILASNGGKIIIDGMIKDIVGLIQSVAMNYKADEIEIRASLAKINVLLELCDTLIGAKKRKELLTKEIEEISK